MAVQTDVTRESAAVFLDITGGETLVYRVTPRGAQPIFTLVDARIDKLLMSNKSSPISQNPLVYERKWPLPIDSPSTATNHTLGIHFLAAMEYRYEVEVYDSAGNLQSTLIDITYRSNAPEDWYFQALSVTAA
jgi:hypothetical protein